MQFIHERGIENWLPIGIELGETGWIPSIVTTTPYRPNNGDNPKVLYTHPKSLAITLEIFYFSETV